MQISNLHQICIKSASHLHQFFHTFCLGKSSKVCTTKPDCHKFSKVQGFNTKAWCTQVFKSTRFQHQSLMYRSSQKYKVSTPKPDVQKFSKVQGFNSNDGNDVHQSLMYTSWKYTIFEAWMYTCELSMWCSCEICMSLYLWIEMYDVLLRFACLCTYGL